MTRDDEKPGKTVERARRFDANTPGSDSRQEPSFSNLEDLQEDGYEEPDRDTNFTSGYRADSVEEEEIYDDTYPEDDEREIFADSESDRLLDADEATADDSDSWLEEDDEEERQRWPMGLVAVAILAVVLLGAGGYGVLQQRAATEAEIQELRAALAVAAGPADGGDSRGALETLQQSYDKLSAQAEALTLENRRLTDTVAGLEAQLGAQQSVPAKPVSVQSSPSSVSQAGVVPNTDKPATTQVTASQTTVAQMTAQPATQQPARPAPAAPKPVAEPPTAAEKAIASPTGPWFVNFGTYATRNMADTWASRVRPAAGEVIVAPNEKDGRTLYRVRVVGLSDRESAQRVARQLESDLRVPALWVGKE